MNVVRCKNGHYFDSDAYAECPHCGEAEVISENSAPAKEQKKSFLGFGRKDKKPSWDCVLYPPPGVSPDELGGGNTITDVIESEKPENTPTPPLKKDHTLDFWETSSHSEGGTSVPEVEEKKEEKEVIDATGAVQTGESEPQKEEKSSSSLQEAVKNASASNEGKTMSYFSTMNSSSTQEQPRCASEPVVGWLVCVSGSHFGESFNIYAGKNSVGRSEENRIVVADDNSISRAKHALIVYEPKKRNFYLQPGDSSGLTYLNDEYITDSHKLAAKDMIELGDSKFMFVPLCGDTFSWEEHMPKGV